MLCTGDHDIDKFTSWRCNGANIAPFAYISSPHNIFSDPEYESEIDYIQKTQVYENDTKAQISRK